MKKKFMITTSAIAFSLGFFVFQNVNTKPKVNPLSDLILSNVEALSADEYHKGTTGMNWKTYTISCTSKTSSTTTVGGTWTWDASVGGYIQGIPVSGSAGGSITGSTTTTTEYQETTYEKDVCGSGSGLYVDAAPSGHPCEG